MTPTPRDLADFVNRWNEYRLHAAEMEKNANLTSAQKMIIHWLIELADKAGPRDLI